MGTVTGFTAERMLAIEDSTVVGGVITANHLILTTRDGTTIDAGNVAGPTGPTGPAGVTSIAVVTSTTRPTGGSRFIGLAIYETDTKLFYIWDGLAWVYRGGIIICTSTTRPTSPILGLEIYETDTRNTLVFNGVHWDPPWGQSWGKVTTPVQLGVDSAAFTAIADIASTTLTWTAVANRRYRVTVCAQVASTVAGGIVTIVVADGSNIEQTRGSVHTGVANSNDTLMFTDEIIGIPAGVKNFHLRGIATGLGTLKGTVAHTYFTVEDAGASGIPV